MSPINTYASIDKRNLWQKRRVFSVFPAGAEVWRIQRSCEHDARHPGSMRLGGSLISESIHGVPRDIYFEQLLGDAFRRMLAVSPRS